MKPLSSERKLTSKTIERIVKFFHWQAKPVMLGAVCLEVGISIARAQEALDDLCHEGVIRPATDAEKVSMGWSRVVNAYVLVEKPNLTTATKWPSI